MINSIAKNTQDPSSARGAAFVWGAFSILSALGAIFCMLAIQPIPFLLLALSYHLCRQASLAYGQRALDLEAQGIGDSIVASKTVKNYILYLRPFASTDQVFKKIVTTNHDGTSETRKYELEKQLQKAAKPIAQLIALGESLEHRGAGRVHVGEALWQEAALELIKNATLIIILPSSQPGTYWELEQLIATKCISKTVFINIPHRFLLFSERKFDQKAQWPSIAKLFNDHGYGFPPYRDMGGLFFYGNRSYPTLEKRLVIKDVGYLRRFLERVIRI